MSSTIIFFPYVSVIFDNTSIITCLTYVLFWSHLDHLVINKNIPISVRCKIGGLIISQPIMFIDMFSELHYHQLVLNPG